MGNLGAERGRGVTGQIGGIRRDGEKAALYRSVSALRERLGVTVRSYPLRVLELCQESGAALVEYADFHTPGLRGMAVFSQKPGYRDLILLNQNRGLLERNFDCAHELYHLAAHREIRREFQCFEDWRSNSFLEWQANSAAAELLAPYQMLLPLLKRGLPRLACWGDFSLLKTNLAGYFRVSLPVLTVRLEELKYEIYQYLRGVPLDSLEFLSAGEQQRRGINVPSLNYNCLGLRHIGAVSPVIYPGGESSGPSFLTK